MKHDATYLLDVIYNARLALQFVRDIDRETLETDLLRRYALERALENMGEAARRLSPAFTASVPDAERSRLIGLRNVLAHQYDRIDLSIIWNIVQNHVPHLIAVLSPLLPPESEEDTP
jgi:uncharacterized protein with HEPN domain